MSGVEQEIVKADEKRLRFDPWKLRLWRTAKGMSGAELASLMGIPKRGELQVSRWETYHTPVGPVTWSKLADALDIDAVELLSDGPTSRKSMMAYEKWIKAGKPRLATWLAKELEGSL